MEQDPLFTEPTLPPLAGPGPLPQAPSPGPAPDDLLWEPSPRGSSFQKFALILVTTLLVLAVLSFAAVRIFQARQHHLAEGYLFRNAAQLLYFHVQESFFGGGVAGTFYPADAACPLFGVTAYSGQHVSGVITDQALTLQDDEGTPPGGQVNVAFTRAGTAMVLISASGEAFDKVRPPIGMSFQPASTAAYAQAQQEFCPSIESRAGHGG